MADCECSADKDGGRGNVDSHELSRGFIQQGLWPGLCFKAGAGREEMRGLASKPQRKGKGTGAEAIADNSQPGVGWDPL